MNPSDSHVPGSLPSHVQGATVPQTAPSGSQPLAAPDKLLEASVAEVKSTMLTYAQNPYARVQQVEKIKAAYISQEFGKTIKVADN